MINIVLYEPEIPQNTGNIMRTAMAANCMLHLIEPLGFKMDERHLKRAGMDYRKNIDFKIYGSWEEFNSLNKGEFFYISRYGKRSHSEFKYPDKDIYLIFGKESTGIPKSILKSNFDRCFRIPMVESARSLNLSNCVAICVYEVQRQLGYKGLSGTEVIKGKDYIMKD
ncbi:MAG: tRNA (cytidine(34)-2'-O)-methyltransferase [Anaerorhabdus sp.]